MAPGSCSTTTSQASYSVEVLSPAAYLHTLYERRDALRRCALDIDMDMGKGKERDTDSTDALRARVREAMQENDPWRELRHVLKLRSTLCGRRYVGTSLTVPLPLPDPLCFPETDEEWDELRRKMRTVEKVSGWVRGVEVSVDVRGKRKRDASGSQRDSASGGRKKRKAELEEQKTDGYDLKDPSPLGFVTAKRVPSQAKGESPKIEILVPSSSQGSSPAAAPPPRIIFPSTRDEPTPPPPPTRDEPPPPPPPAPADTHPSIASIPEDTFFPPSFPSHLATSTPPNTRTRARPPDIPGEMKDLRELLARTRTPSPKKRKKPLFRRASSSFAEEESMDFGVNPVASAGSPMPDDDSDDAPLYAATQLRGAYDSQFDLDGGLGDVEGFLERDVQVFGDEEEVEEEKDELEETQSLEKDEIEVEDEVENESMVFGKYFNLPRRSASTTGSGGPSSWFGRR